MQLPIEILAEIASYSPAEIWTFASVCRYWRFAALLHPKCWSTIHIKQGEDTRRPEAMEHRLKLWAERGGNSQLELLLRGPFHHALLSEPFSGRLPRIRTLYLDAWGVELDEKLQTVDFPGLESLSIATPHATNQSHITLKRVSTVFFGISDEAKGNLPTKAPRLRKLALSRVNIGTTRLPSSIESLKLVECSVAPSISLLSLLDPTRHSLRTLCLQDVTQVMFWPPGREEKNTTADYPDLTALTLASANAPRALSLEFISHLTCPNLTRLTCDDNFLPLLHPHHFPSLACLYVRSFQLSSLKTYRKVLSQFGIVSLTIFRDPCARCGLNVLLWSMSQCPELGKTLRHLRYLTKGKPVVQSLLDMVNKERCKSTSLVGRTVFASQTVLYVDRHDFDSPWDAEFWWAQE